MNLKYRNLDFIMKVKKHNDISLYKGENCFCNFIDCVISGKETNTLAEVHHRSTTFAHLGNISILLKQELEWDPKTECFVNNTLANALLDRPMREPWDAKYKYLLEEL